MVGVGQKTHALYKIVLSLGITVVSGYASDASTSLPTNDWQTRFAHLTTISTGQVMGHETASILDDLAKNAETLENRQSILNLIPDLYRNAKAFTVTSPIRATLCFLINTTTNKDEQLSQIKVLGQLAGILRKFPPTLEDVTNQEEVQKMLELLANVDKPEDVRILAIDGLKRLPDPMILSRKVQANLITFSSSLLKESGTTQGAIWIRVKGAVILTKLGGPLEFQPLMDVLRSSVAQTSDTDILRKIAEGLKYLCKTETTEEQRSQLLQVLQPLVKGSAPHVRQQVIEGFKELAKKSSALKERQVIRQTLTFLAKDEDCEIRRETAAGFQSLAEKETEPSEWVLIQTVLQDLLRDEIDSVRQSASYAYKALAQSAQSVEERLSLIEVVPSLFADASSYVGLSGLSIFKSLAEKSTTPEERLSISRKIIPILGKITDSDFLYEVAPVLSILAEKATTPTERHLVADGLIQLIGNPAVWAHDSIIKGLVALYESEQKSIIKACIEKFMGTFGIKLLESLSETEKTAEDLTWIQQTYLTYIKLEATEIWYSQQQAISSLKKFCLKISYADQRKAMEQELEKIMQEKQEKEKAKYDAIPDYLKYINDD